MSDDQEEVPEAAEEQLENLGRRSSTRLTMEEKSLILDMRIKGGVSVDQIAFRLGRDRKTIGRFVSSMTDSTPLATAMIRAGAHKLAKKVLEKADVDQALDILSRPNIGVLRPIQKVSDGPQIMISVNQDSLGGVAPANMVNTALPATPLTAAIDSVKLAIVGGNDGNSIETPEGQTDRQSGGEDVQGGSGVPAETGGGLRAAPDGASAPQGPAGVPADSGDARPGRQRRVADGDSRVAILNPRRPRSSIHLTYDI